MKTVRIFLILIMLFMFPRLYAYQTFDPYCDVFLASPPYTFDLQFRALALQPNSSNLHYAVEATSLPSVSPQWNIFDIHPKYHFGFDLQLEAIIHTRQTKIITNWEHVHSSDSAFHTVLLPTNMVGPFFEIGPDASDYKRAQGAVTFHFDTFNLTYGQYMIIGPCLETNFFGGVNITRIRENLFSQFSSLDGTIFRTITTPFQFLGGGPEFGIDFCYTIFDGLCFTGKTMGALLVGTMKNSTTYQSTSTALIPLGVTPPNIQNTTIHNRTQIVPSFEQRLELAYFYAFCSHYEFKIALGYEVRVYLNVLQSTDIGSEVVAPPATPNTVGVYARTFQRTLSNFALSGPYGAISIAF